MWSCETVESSRFQQPDECVRCARRPSFLFASISTRGGGGGGGSDLGGGFAHMCAHMFSRRARAVGRFADFSSSEKRTRKKHMLNIDKLLSLKNHPLI